ncbi:MAG: ribosome biogenesis GTPase Der, partial [Lachnospiraceae bacterium]|nr:ribosome biogenesis GTPase Der [Lachnospiraceae bacterium]
VVLAVNKVDDFKRQEADVYEFYNLGLGEPFPVSAEGRQGLGDMLEAVCAHLPEAEETEPEDVARVAIIGKPNTGKSSLINRLLGEERLIVSDIAGTTRDAVDTEVTFENNRYVFIDTAGLRRKNKIKEELERYMIIRAVGAIERADVCILVIDAEEGVTEQDAHIAGIAHDRGKGMIIAVNKWDLVEKDNRTVKEYTEKIRRVLSFMPYAEIIFLSAKTGQRLTKLYPMIDKVNANGALRVKTGVLNEVLTKALSMQQPPTDRGRPLKVYYMTQVGVRPPAFVVFVNDKKLMHYSYTRYIENRLREAFGFGGTPLKFMVRERKEKG